MTMTETETKPRGKLLPGRGFPARATFLDGPAREAKSKYGTDGLNLGRAPTFLRAVIESTGTLDALDQPEDTPNTEELVYVYELAQIYHARGVGWCAEYMHRDDVDGEQVRDRAAWVEWCEAEARRRGTWSW